MAEETGEKEQVNAAQGAADTRVEQRAKQIMEGRTTNIESPIDKGNRIIEEINKKMEQFEELNSRFVEMEKRIAESQLAGRGFAGQRQVTQEDLDKEKANEIVGRFFKR